MEYPKAEKTDAVKYRSKQGIATSFIKNLKLLKTVIWKQNKKYSLRQ